MEALTKFLKFVDISVPTDKLVQFIESVQVNLDHSTTNDITTVTNDSSVDDTSEYIDDESQDQYTEQQNDLDTTEGELQEFKSFVVGRALAAATTAGSLRKLVALIESPTIVERDNLRLLIDDNITKAINRYIQFKMIKSSNKEVKKNIIRVFEYVNEYDITYIYDEVSELIIETIRDKTDIPEKIIDLIVDTVDTFGINCVKYILSSDLRTVLKNILFARVVEMISYRYDKTKLGDFMTYLETYDPVIAEFTSHDDISPETIHHVVFNLTHEWLKSVIKSHDKIKEIFDLFARSCPGEKLRCLVKVLIDRESPILGVLTHYQLTQYLDEGDILDLILRAHGVPVNLRTEFLISNRKRYDGTETLPMAIKINMGLLKFINDLWPSELKKFVHEYFASKFCVLTNKHLRKDQSVLKQLIAYAVFMIDRGILPYDHLKYNMKIVAVAEESPCHLCLHDTNWTNKRCGHFMCRECYATKLYSSCSKYGPSLSSKLCVQCDSTKRFMKVVRRMEQEDEEDEEE